MPGIVITAKINAITAKITAITAKITAIHDRRPALRQQQLQHVAFQRTLKPAHHTW